MNSMILIPKKRPLSRANLKLIFGLAVLIYAAQSHFCLAKSQAQPDLSQANSSISKRLLGAWKLVSYTEIDVETGTNKFPMGEHPSGFILYTSDGYMSAQIQAAGRSLFAEGDMFRGELEEYKAAGQSYLAYSGAYDVNEVEGKVTHKIKVSLFPNWAEKTQVRLVDFPGNKLRLRFESPQRSNGSLKTAELIWERSSNADGK